MWDKIVAHDGVEESIGPKLRAKISSKQDGANSIGNSAM
jgi:hypothetical protein